MVLTGPDPTAGEGQVDGGSEPRRPGPAGQLLPGLRVRYRAGDPGTV
jgi:hypothetical protein